jgi:hypothetical protein
MMIVLTGITGVSLMLGAFLHNLWRRPAVLRPTSPGAWQFAPAAAVSWEVFIRPNAELWDTAGYASRLIPGPGQFNLRASLLSWDIVVLAGSTTNSCL